MVRRVLVKYKTLFAPLSHLGREEVMALPKNNDNKLDPAAMYGGSVHVEVGTVEATQQPQSKWMKFYRSVLFQMVLFGA